MRNTIYFYGCSYTAGQELFHEEVIHKYELKVKRIQRKYRNDWHDEYFWNPACSKEWYSMMHMQMEYYTPEVLERERKHSWPSKVSKNLNCNFVNNGLYGAGMDTIFRVITNQLESGEINSDTPIVVCLPNTYRYLNMHDTRVTVLMWERENQYKAADYCPHEEHCDMFYYLGMKFIRDNFKKVCFLRGTDAKLGHNELWDSKISSLGIETVPSFVTHAYNHLAKDLESDWLKVLMPGGHPRQWVHDSWADLVTPYVSLALDLQ